MVPSNETQFCLLEITGGKTTEEQEEERLPKPLPVVPQCNVCGTACVLHRKKRLIYYLVLFFLLSAGVKVHGSAQRATYIINELHRPACRFHCCKRQSIRSCSHVAGVNTEEDAWKEQALLFWCECNTIISHLYWKKPQLTLPVTGGNKGKRRLGVSCYLQPYGKRKKATTHSSSPDAARRGKKYQIFKTERN